MKEKRYPRWVDEKMSNQIAGNGQHSHEVPTSPGVVLLLRDGQHDGTEVYAVDRPGRFTQYRFISLDRGEIDTRDRCVLVRLSGVNVDDLDRLDHPYGVDLDCPDGIALVGLDLDDSTEGLGEVLWDSRSHND